MAKVVTSQGMTDFVQTGKHETLDNGSKKHVSTPHMEVKKDVVIDLKPAESKQPEAKEPEKAAEPEDIGLEAEDSDLVERAQRRISKKHREMKQAQALADRLKGELADTENFSKSQYQRAQLAEERAATLERELSEIRAKAPKAPEPGTVKPDPKDFYDEQGQFKAFEYAEKLSEFSALQAVEKDRAEQRKAQQAAEAAVVEAQARARVEESKAKHSDWQRVVDEAGVNVAPMVAQYMTVSEHIGEIAYYLAKNPEFAARINAMNPIKAIAEIGKLEAQWDKPEESKEEPVVIPKASSGAPAPIKPLTGQGSPGVNTDPAKMTPKELLAYTREREAQRKRR